MTEVWVIQKTHGIDSVHSSRESVDDRIKKMFVRKFDRYSDDTITITLENTNLRFISPSRQIRKYINLNKEEIMALDLSGSNEITITTTAGWEVFNIRVFVMDKFND